MLVITLFKFFVEPARCVLPSVDVKGRMNFKIGARHEFSNALFTLHHQGERWRLHAAHRGQMKTAALRVKGGHGAGAIDAHQPIRLGARPCCVRQRQHASVTFELAKAFANGVGRH